MEDTVYILLDDYGFWRGERTAFAIEQGILSAEGTIRVPLPEEPLGVRKKWYWDAAASQWEQRTDNRGHFWYDPHQIDMRWTAKLPGDTPPAGYIYLKPGTTPMPTDAQKLREAKVAATVNINAERDRNLQQPMIHDGGVFDADSRAVDNLKGKLEEIRAMTALDITPPPESLFWIDYENNVRTFPDTNAFLQWLSGMVVAISTRTSLAYLEANHRKAAVNAATTVIGVWAAANGANEPLEL